MQEMMQEQQLDIPFNKLFGFFLKQKGVSPRFRKIDAGYRTYDKSWILSILTMSITHLKPIRVWNGYEFEVKCEETRYVIKRKEKSLHVVFLYTKLI
jgi:hypothetical protein